MMEAISAWTTWDEIDFITYTAGDEVRRNEKVPSISERVLKLTVWIKTSETRKWPRNIDVDKCQEHAVNLLKGMIGFATIHEVVR